jgi:hypothetical protein
MSVPFVSQIVPTVPIKPGSGWRWTLIGGMPFRTTSTGVDPAWGASRSATAFETATSTSAVFAAHLSATDAFALAAGSSCTCRTTGMPSDRATAASGRTRSVFACTTFGRASSSSRRNCRR